MATSSLKSTETVTISYEKHNRVLVEGLWNFMVTKHRVEDVTCGGGILKVHQIILDVFLPPEKQAESLAALNVHRCHLEALLQFIYQGTVTVQRERLDGLLLMAKDMNFQMLVDAVQASSCLNSTGVRSSDTNSGTDTKSIGTVKCKRKQISIEPWEPVLEINEDCEVQTKRKRSSDQPWKPKIELLSRNSVKWKQSASPQWRPVSLSSAVAVRCKKSAHMRAPISKFKCPECQFESSNSTVVKSHQAVVHSRKKQFKCEKCDFVTSWKFVLTNHVYRMHPVPGHYFCSICQQRFGSGTELDDHLAIHEEVGTFRCTHCEQAFTQNKFLVAHVDRVHIGRNGDGGFECDVCAKWYKSRRELDSHYRAHTQELPFKCPHCEKRFNYASNRTSHVARIHTQGGNFACEVCGKLFAARRILVDHQRSHTQERPFKCPQCDKNFKKKTDVKEHVTKVHAAQGAELLPHGCPHCIKRFNHPFKLRQHVARMHGQGSSILACGTCGKVCRTRLHLVEHQVTHTEELPFKCPHCEKRFKDSPNLKMHVARLHGIDTVISLPHACSECDERFGDMTNLRVHMARVHRQGPDRFACDFCFEEFKTCPDMSEHRQAHLQEKSHKCQHCDKRFKGAKSLSNHVVRFHGQEADNNGTTSAVCFVCDVCGKQCRSRKLLRAHLQTHIVTEKTHKCPQCDYAATSQGPLNAHLEVVHGVGPGRFKCETCGRRCSSRVALERHTRTHTKEKPFKCEQCSCAFAVKTALKQHTDTIHGMGKFRCETCGRAYPCTGQLKKHRRSHTQEKPFACPHCDLRTAWKENLVKHIAAIHGDVKYTCEICGKSLNSARLLGRHRLTHDKAKKSRSTSVRTAPIIAVPTSGSTSVSPACDVCGKRFECFESLVSHKLSHAVDNPLHFYSVQSVLDSST